MTMTMTMKPTACTVRLPGTRAAAAIRAVRPIVVGVSMDPASAVALVRGSELARSLRVPLLVAHVAEKQGEGGGRSSSSLLRRSIRAWARFATGVELSESSIRITTGNPVRGLLDTAERNHAEILVLGGHHSSAPGSTAELSSRVVEQSKLPVLLAAERRRNGAFVVASDLSNPRAPVVDAAASLASRLGLPVTVVHNVPGSAEQLVFWNRMEKLSPLVAGLVVPSAEGTITHRPRASDGVLHVARAKDVDVVALGAHPALGSTAREILSEAERSLLFIPLPRVA